MEFLKPVCKRIELVGSIRRQKDLVGDVDILCIPLSNSLVDEAIKSFADSIISGINGKWQVIFDFKDVRYNVLKANEDSWGASLLHSTGSHDFNVQLRGIAKASHLKLNQYGLFKADSSVCVASKTEEDIFRYLGIDYVSPKDRSAYLKSGQSFEVPMSSGEGYWTVTKKGDLYSCNCPHHTYRRCECKHILSIKEKFTNEEN